MRILHVSALYVPYAFGGAEVVVQTLAETMAAAGHEVAVASLVPVSGKAEESEALNQVERWPFEHRNPIWLIDHARYPALVRMASKIVSLFNIMTASDLARTLDEFRPDVVHTHSMVAFPPWFWKVARQAGVRTVHTLHDYDLLCLRSTLYKDGRLCGKRHLACAMASRYKDRYTRYIDEVVAITQSVMDAHLDFGVFADKAPTHRHVVWNPVHADTTVSPARPPRTTRDVLTFGFIGRLVPEKGIDVLIDACRELPPTGWRLRIAGVAPNDDTALRQAASGLPIEFLGYVPQREFMKDIDVLVVPSVWREPFGLTVVEAFAAGVPVIGSDIGGIAEIIEHIDTAWLVEPGSRTELTRRMRLLIDEPAKADLNSSRVSDVLRRTSSKQVAARYLGIYGALS